VAGGRRDLREIKDGTRLVLEVGPRQGEELGASFGAHVARSLTLSDSSAAIHLAMREAAIVSRAL